MFRTPRVEVTLLAISLALTTACQNRESGADQLTRAETPKPAATSAAHPAAKIEPPQSITEVQQVTARTYKEAVTVDRNRADSFVVGDFNGDGSQDIAVVVKPDQRMLSELNSEYANWILEDPVELGKLAAHPNEPQSAKKRRLTVAARDNLLAVIHGYQAEGWRNPKATQTYLLKNGAGKSVTTQSAEAVLNETANKQPLPPLRGDVIRETLDGTPGFIYWTGARYAWHPSP